MGCLRPHFFGVWSFFVSSQGSGGSWVMGDRLFEKQPVLEEQTVLSPTQVEAARRLVLRQPDGDVLVRMLGLEP